MSIREIFDNLQESGYATPKARGFLYDLRKKAAVKKGLNPDSVGFSDVADEIEKMLKAMTPSGMSVEVYSGGDILFQKGKTKIVIRQGLGANDIESKFNLQPKAESLDEKSVKMLAAELKRMLAG